MIRGWIHALRDEPEAAIECCNRSQRLSPFDPMSYLNACGFAAAHLAARRFEPAIEWADRALHDQPRLITAIRIKVIANAHLARLPEARIELARVLTLHPGLTIAEYRGVLAPVAAPALQELYVAGMRLAGLPEG